MSFSNARSTGARLIRNGTFRSMVETKMIHRQFQGTRHKSSEAASNAASEAASNVASEAASNAASHVELLGDPYIWSVIASACGSAYLWFDVKKRG